MMQKNRTNPIALIVTALAMIPLLVVNWRIMEERQVEDELNKDLINRKMPATLALTTQAVGPFRGLISNGLWWRAMRLQDEGDHFEAIQLADWISSLQPKLSSVWTWQGWNMAYNIAAAYDDPEEKWKWTMEGLSLLRDRGLRYNPRDADISLDIARIFKEKIGENRMWSRRWAVQMMRYLKMGDRNEIEQLLAAPSSEKALRKNLVIDALLDDADGLGLDLLDLNTFNMTDTERQDLSLLQREILGRPENAETLEMIRRYVARQGLENDLKMNLTHMYNIDRKYGPLDWRLYQAHVIYWGADDSYDTIELDKDYQFPYHRQALIDAFYSGKLLYLDDKGITTGPNLEIMAAVHKYVVEHAQQFADSSQAGGLTRTFHEWAVLLLYVQMYEEQAREMYEDVRAHLMTPDEKKRWTYEAFIAEKAPQMLTRGKTKEQSALVYTALSQAYYWMGRGDPYQAKGYERLAKLIWTQNLKRFAHDPTKRLPPFEELKKTVFSQTTGEYSAMPQEIKDRLIELSRGTGAIEVAAPEGARPKIDIGMDAHKH